MQRKFDIFFRPWFVRSKVKWKLIALRVNFAVDWPTDTPAAAAVAVCVRAVSSSAVDEFLLKISNLAPKIFKRSTTFWEEMKTTEWMEALEYIHWVAPYLDTRGRPKQLITCQTLPPPFIWPKSPRWDLCKIWMIYRPRFVRAGHTMIRYVGLSLFLSLWLLLLWYFIEAVC